MADREISQLVLQVDAKIAVAQRELQLLARDVRQQTGDINNSLATTEVAHQRMGRAFGQARIAQMELSHVVTASVDAYAAGFSPLRIMTLEMGRLAEAATFLGGSGGSGVLGKLAGFMGGRWGIAVLLGVSVLSQLIAKHYAAGDSVDDLVAKMKKEALQQARSDEAHKLFAQTLDGVDEALRSVDKAYAAYENRLKGSSQVELDAAKNALAIASARRAEAAATLAAARAELERHNALAIGAETKGHVDPQLVAADAARARIDQAQAQLSGADAAIARASQDIEKFQSIVTVENAAADAADKIKRKYDGLIEATRKEYLAQHKVGDELARQIELLKKKEQAELKALENAKKGPGEFGKQVSFADAAAIAKGAGLTVTSAYRSTTHQAELYNDPKVNVPGNPVARPGTSAHEGVNGKWALDIAFAPGLTPAKLKKLYGDHGVSLSAVYKESGHFHIEGSRSQAADAERQAAAAARDATRDTGAFNRQNDQLDQELAQAKSQLTGDYHQLAGLANKQVDAETQKLLDSIQQQQDLGDLTKVQADELRTKINELSADKKALIAKRELEQTLSDQHQAADQSYQYQVDDLRFADEMATTQAEHRKLQLAILDIVYEQKRLDLEYAKAQAERNQNLAEANRIQAEIDRLPQDKAQDQVRAERGTMNPLEAWADQFKSDKVIEEFQRIQVEGLDRLADSLTDVVMGTKSLGQAFKDVAGEIIAEIVKMTIKMLIFRAISGAIGGALGGGGSQPWSEGPSIWGDLGPLGLPGFASGGSMMIGGRGGTDRNLLSLNGSPIARVGRGEELSIMPRAPRIGVPRASAGGGNMTLTVNVNARDAVLTSTVKGWVAQGILEAAPHIVKAARDNTVRSIQRPRLAG